MRIILFIALFLSLQSQAQIIRANPLYRPFAAAAPATCDTSASSFISITGITGTDSAAICTLVKDLKDSSLWTSMAAIYPFVGGSATTNKYNLKDPRDLDAAFRLTFYGGWTHSSTGALPNGTSGYARTYFIPSVQQTANNSHLSYYSRTTGGASESMIDMGVAGTSYRSYQIIIRFSNVMYFQSNTVSGGELSSANTDAKGYYIASTISGGSTIGQKNTTQITGSSTSSLADYEVIIGARNSLGTIGYNSNRECAFATMGEGLTAAQMLTLNTIVEKFNDALSRGVQ